MKIERECKPNEWLQENVVWRKNGRLNQINLIQFISFNSLISVNQSISVHEMVDFRINQWMNWNWFEFKFHLIKLAIQQIEKYYNSNCYIGTSYRGDTLSNSQYSLHTWILL